MRNTKLMVIFSSIVPPFLLHPFMASNYSSLMRSLDSDALKCLALPCGSQLNKWIIFCDMPCLTEFSTEFHHNVTSS